MACRLRRVWPKLPSCSASWPYGVRDYWRKHIIELAREDGFKRMVLDTVAPLEAAISLYRKLGFEEVEPYYHNPFEDVIYFGIDL